MPCTAVDYRDLILAAMLAGIFNLRNLFSQVFTRVSQMIKERLAM